MTDHNSCDAYSPGNDSDICRNCDGTRAAHQRLWRTQSESGGRHPTLNFDVQSPMGLDDSSPKTDPINVHGAMAAGKDRPYTQSAERRTTCCGIVPPDVPACANCPADDVAARDRARLRWHRQCGLDGSRCPTERDCEVFNLGFEAALLYKAASSAPSAVGFGSTVKALRDFAVVIGHHEDRELVQHAADLIEALAKSSAASAAALITDIRNDAEADAVGVDRFRTAMSNKLAKKCEDGRGGWNHEPYTVQPDRGDRVQRFGCEVSYLRRLLREHVEKGDMVDIANLAMMIWNRENPRG